ncbi:MAG TPA: tetratricopeptide repeat protein [Candidatus Polarisedimenticolaceae bacterium]|nr:tetratricopeptide repeat protein [Candidatus Polarisedimenticolaceae bacterium]
MSFAAITLSVLTAFAGRVESASTPAKSCITEPRPSTVADWMTRGNCLRETGDAEQALTAYQNALRLSPDGSRDLYLAMAQTYEALGRADEQLATIQAAERLASNDPEVLYQAGIAYEVLDRYPEALEKFNKVVAIKPDDNRAHRNIGFVLLQQHQPEQAIAPLRAAIEIDPNDWKAHANLAEAYRATYATLGKEMQALTAGPRAWAANDPAKLRHDEIGAKLRTFDYKNEAIKEAQEAARLQPTDYRTWSRLGTMLQEQPQRADEAADAFKRALALSPNDHDVMCKLAVAQKSARRYAESYATFESVVEKFGNEPWIPPIMGGLALDLGKLDMAEKHYRLAIQIDSRNGMSHYGLARTLKRLGRADEGDRELGIAKTLQPQMASVMDSWYREP